MDRERPSRFPRSSRAIDVEFGRALSAGGRSAIGPTSVAPGRDRTPFPILCPTFHLNFRRFLVTTAKRAFLGVDLLNFGSDLAGSSLRLSRYSRCAVSLFPCEATGSAFSQPIWRWESRCTRQPSPTHPRVVRHRGSDPVVATFPRYYRFRTDESLLKS